MLDLTNKLSSPNSRLASDRRREFDLQTNGKEKGSQPAVWLQHSRAHRLHTITHLDKVVGNVALFHFGFAVDFVQSGVPPALPLLVRHGRFGIVAAIVVLCVRLHGRLVGRVTG